MQTANTIHKYKGHTKTFYRQFFIKKKNGRNRRICAPSPELLAYQRSQLQSLSHTFNSKSFVFFESQEIGLPVSSNGLVLPCGASGRWTSL